MDVRDSDRFDALVHDRRPSALFHLAGLIRGSPPDLFEVNFRGACNILASLRRHVPDATVVLVGSGAEYGRVPCQRQPVRETEECLPISAYGQSKLAATAMGMLYHRMYGTNVVTARPFNIIGPGVPTSVFLGAVLGRVREARRNGFVDTVPVGNVATSRDFVDVRDAARAIAALGRSRMHAGEIFNVSSGRLTPLRSLLAWIVTRSGGRVRFEEDATLRRTDDVEAMFGCNDKVVSAGMLRESFGLADSLEAAWSEALPDEEDAGEQSRAV